MDSEQELEQRRIIGLEKFTDAIIIGTYIERNQESGTKTKQGMIVYSKTGTHVYPRKEKKHESN